MTTTSKPLTISIAPITVEIPVPSQYFSVSAISATIALKPIEINPVDLKNLTVGMPDSISINSISISPISVSPISVTPIKFQPISGLS